MVALVHAERDDDAVLARGAADGLRRSARHDDGVLIEADVLRPALHRRQDEGKVRIPGNEGFREHDNLGALRSRLVDGRHDARKRRLARR